MAAPTTKLATADSVEPVSPAKKKTPEVLHVLDSTAIRSVENPSGNRIHEMIVDGVVKPFTFEPGRPLEMPKALAMRFLKHQSFKLTDAEGNVKVFRRQPKQAHELQAGEQLVIGDDQTVANYDELSNPALQHRCLEITGSEHFAVEKPSRTAMIAFLVGHSVKTKQETASKQPDTAPGEFTPPAEPEDEFLDEAAA